jgi:hypothetical protein
MRTKVTLDAGSAVMQAPRFVSATGPDPKLSEYTIKSPIQLTAQLRNSLWSELN